MIRDHSLWGHESSHHGHLGCVNSRQFDLMVHFIWALHLNVGQLTKPLWPRTIFLHIPFMGEWRKIKQTPVHTFNTYDLQPLVFKITTLISVRKRRLTEDKTAQELLLIFPPPSRKIPSQAQSMSLRHAAQGILLSVTLMNSQTRSTKQKWQQKKDSTTPQTTLLALSSCPAFLGSIVSFFSGSL